ncbi:UNVERIFIED_CONTAM: hypothetical protein HDU68_000301 [Siphonaria sp. JEL0065]|nr:hypothetical protein HDU68_000301 [Siphonaria sp. JEL0065]
MYLHNATSPTAPESTIESSDYLFTGGLLRGAARTAAFPVSACLPSAGGGVFKTTNANPQQKAVFVKTSRDAHDGSTWNAGILREDPKLKHARERRSYHGYNSADSRRQSGGSRGVKNPGSGGSSGSSTGTISDVLKSRLASVYRKQHLEDVLGSMDISDQIEKELAVEEALVAAEEEKRTLQLRQREGSRVEKPPVSSTCASRTELYPQHNHSQYHHHSHSHSHHHHQQQQQNHEPHPHHQPPQTQPQVSPHRVAARERGISLVAPDHVLLRTRDFTQSLLNESTTSSSELLSSLTGVLSPGSSSTSRDSIASQFSGPPHKSIMSLGNGLPPPRPDSSQRGWENVKATLFEKSNRRTSWADLNRDTEYIRKYDVNAIPGLEVQVGTMRYQRRPKLDF